MTSRTRRRVGPTTVLFLMVAALFFSQQGMPRAESSTPSQQRDSVSSGKGRIYVFRMVRPFGAHIDDRVTINGVFVQRVSPGNGFFCDVRPGNYVIGLSQRKAHPLNVPVAADQQQYISVMLRNRSVLAPRSGALPSDQSFDIRLLDPAYGAQRVREYHLTKANCQP